MSRDGGQRRAGGPREVRVIGGQWRRRRLRFPSLEGLRPTPDRVRETLFNWLQGRIYGRRCLDLFAGSGALGFEAASRGAGEVVLVEAQPAAAAALRENARQLQAAQVQVMECRAQDFLRRPPRAFDLVFLDPPFGKGWVAPMLNALRSGWLARHGMIYVESELPLAALALSDALRCVRQGRAGQVNFFLLEDAEDYGGHGD